jgi:hypothetical protein
VHVPILIFGPRRDLGVTKIIDKLYVHGRSVDARLGSGLCLTDALREEFPFSLTARSISRLDLMTVDDNCTNA